MTGSRASGLMKMPVNLTENLPTGQLANYKMYL